ncbi:60S ribosomal protein L23a [Galemys pyrenaicus]|uniref:60S ribosomal protein L23a n=1 Tax=Galemys pyrenaicus TaxID=202257 RepID=A0A8J6A8T0_GALPY|nr:60S ribosomal protein L23a [Galemys pyrenaicus]
MATTAKKKGPAPPKVEAQAAALKTRKAVLKGIQTLALKATQAGIEEETNDHCAIRLPLSTESAKRKIEDNTPVFMADVKANKHQITQAVKMFYDTDVAKVNTLTRPGGEKKAYVPLACDYDILDVANKTGII